jgi:hypothetical protein
MSINFGVHEIMLENKAKVYFTGTLSDFGQKAGPDRPWPQDHESGN